EGTLARGTAVRLKKLTGLVAGKTGTSNDENDAWFVCFTNDITVAVWVGYDDKKVYKNLGGGNTGGRVALPIANLILEAAFELFGQPQPLQGPPDQIKNLIVEKQIDLKSGQVDAGDFVEIFRVDDGRSVFDTRDYMLRSNERRLAISQEVASDEEETVEPVRPPTTSRPVIEVEAVMVEPARPANSSTYRPGVDDAYQI